MEGGTKCTTHRQTSGLTPVVSGFWRRVTDMNPFIVRTGRWFLHTGTIVEVEVRKLAKDPWEMVIRAVQPLLWLGIFGSAFARIRMLPEGTTDYTTFLAPGILAQSVTFASIFFGITLIWEKDQGLTQKYLASPLARSALVVGKLSAAGLRSLIQGVVILAAAGVLGAKLELGIGAVAGVLAFTLLGAAFFAGFSLGIAALLKTRDRMMGMGQLITLPLFFASNALYPVGIMPPWLQVIATGNPMSYLVDGFRGLLVPAHPSHLSLDALVLGVATLVMTLVATWLYPRLAR